MHPVKRQHLLRDRQHTYTYLTFARFSLVRRTFEDFRSPWIAFFECSSAIPWAMSRAIPCERFVSSEVSTEWRNDRKFPPSKEQRKIKGEGRGTKHGA